MDQYRVAIVTGASQGIGRSTAIRLAKDFSAIVLAARSGDALAKTEEVVRAAGAEPFSLALDLSKVESPETVIKSTLDHFGRIDALLNIATRKFPEEAGISRYGEPEEIAELLAFMVSPVAKWMTGTSVRMDGGEVKGI
jgi:3-oxoacyl-[acyl-carrier protein] reductase